MDCGGENEVAASSREGQGLVAEVGALNPKEVSKMVSATVSYKVFPSSTTVSAGRFGPVTDTGRMILAALLLSGKPMSISDISHVTGVDRNNVKRVLWYYCNVRGWVTRVSRGTYALTRDGRAYAEKASETLSAKKILLENLLKSQKYCEHIKKVTQGYMSKVLLKDKRKIRLNNVLTDSEEEISFRREHFLKIRKIVYDELRSRCLEKPPEDAIVAVETLLVHALKTGENKLEYGDFIQRSGLTNVHRLFRWLQTLGVGYEKKVPEAGGGYTVVLALRTDLVLKLFRKLEREGIHVPESSKHSIAYKNLRHRAIVGRNIGH